MRYNQLMRMEQVLSKEIVDCLLCGKRDYRMLYPTLPNTVQCSCGLVYANPRLKETQLAGLYSKEYFESHSSEELGYDNYVSDKNLVEKTFRRRLRQLERQCLKPKGRVLDVGCAAGYFFYGGQVHGMESRWCRNIRILL